MGNKINFKRIIEIIIVVVAVILVVSLLILYANEKPSNNTITKVSTNNDFNDTWKRYDGLRSGTQVQAMITAMVNNAEENKTDATKLIDLAYQTQDEGDVDYIYSTVKKPNISDLENAKDQINSKRNYTVEFVYSKKTGNISGIIIKADSNKTISFSPNED
jgi:hypothetical protein